MYGGSALGVNDDDDNRSCTNRLTPDMCRVLFLCCRWRVRAL